MMLLFVTVVPVLTFAQNASDQRSLNTRIADLLAQLPARDATQLNETMHEISSLGPDGYATLIAELTPTRNAHNSLLEYAIGGYSAYVMQKAKETERANAVVSYCTSLKSTMDLQMQNFIVSQLEIVGKDDAIPCLRKYLESPAVADAASRALVKINTPLAKVTLLSALPAAKDTAQMYIIEALGLVRAKEAVPMLQGLAVSTAPNVAKSALAALANIADPSSVDLFLSAAEKTMYRFDHDNAIAATLRYAAMLLADGHHELAEQIAKRVHNKSASDSQVHTRTAALNILVSANSKAQSSLLLEAIEDESWPYRAAALKLAHSTINESTAPLWLKKLKKTDPYTKVGIIEMFAAVNNKAALPPIMKLLKSKNHEVKIAAINATAKIGQEEVLEVLYKVMQKGDTSAITITKETILQINGNGVDEKMASYLPKAKPEVQIAILQLLASRAATNQIAYVYPLLNDKNDAVRRAAFLSLKDLSGTGELPKLFSLLEENESKQETTDIQDAIIVAYKGADIGRAEEELLSRTASTPNKKASYYRILASSGKEQALKTILEVYQNDQSNRKEALLALTSWHNEKALPVLLNIANNASTPEDLDKALRGYLRIVRLSSYNDDQRFLKLNDAMAITKTKAQKLLILTELGKANTFNAIILAGKYLDDPTLQQAGASAIMNIVLAQPGYHGNIVKELLKKTILLLKGADSEYQKEALSKYLFEMPQEEGFVSLFNGVDLSGWKGLVADPIKRSKMDAKTLAAAQREADAKMLESWKVEEGELRFANHGENLATVKKYGNFEMLVDWKIIDDKKQNGDAGIYLRGTPQVQIWDTARIKDGAQVGSGGLYNNQTNPSKPLRVADNKLDEWNTFRILMQGDRVTVYLNGELVTDNVILENYWDRSLPIFAEEQIELQAHGSPVAYRNIYIREIPSAPLFKLTSKELKDGYKVLFDGSNMHYWTGNTNEYIIENGNISLRPKPGAGSGGNLFTKEQYGDFILKFDFQLSPGANNGLGIRAPLKGDAAYEGMELQILDNNAEIYKNLESYQYHGSVYGVLAAKKGFLKPVGEWNSQEVLVKGSKIKVILNGTTILDGDINMAKKNGAVDGKPHPGLLRESGHIGFLGHGSPIQFKNIRIKELRTNGE